MPHDPLTLPPDQRRDLELLTDALGTVEPSPEEHAALACLAQCDASIVADVAALFRRVRTRGEAPLIVAEGLVSGYREQ